MSKRRGQGLAPSLFPFLAVLVCTLGTLILLLALVAQNATAAAQQKTRADRIAKADPETKQSTSRLSRQAVQALLDEEQFRVEQLVAIRDQQTADLENRRDQLTHIEDHLQRLTEKLKRLSDEVEQAMGDQDLSPIDENELATLHAQIAQHRQDIQRLRRETNDTTPRVVIVPHKGPNGTARRPVYLECTAEGITVWPENSRISIDELRRANYSANPLDAALRVVRLHAMKNYGDSTPPYPLLVVRPDGVESYAAARVAMEDWDDQFGYELVPAHVNLAFTRPDPNLKQQIDRAISTAIDKQNSINSIVNRAIGSGRSAYGRRVGEGPDGSSRGAQRRLPTLSAASLDRDGRANGFRSHREFAKPRPRAEIGGSPYARGSYGAYGTYGGNLQANPSGMDAAAARRLASQMQRAATELRDQASGGSPESNIDHEGSERALQSADSFSGSEDAVDSPHNQLLNPTSPATTDSSRRGSAFQTFDHVNRSPSRSTAGSTNGSQAPGQQSNDGMRPPSAAQSGMSMPADASDRSNTRHSAPPETAAAKQLVNPQARDWALPASVAGMNGNAVVRSIHVQCFPDRFVLVPTKAGHRPQTFMIVDEDVAYATIRLATAIRDRIERWGPALPGGRWQPVMDVSVMPGGGDRYEQLQLLMGGSGVDITARESK